jgi:hypothetical protein
VLEHPPYSPDPPPPAQLLFLFQKIKEILKGGHLNYIDDIRINMAKALKAIPQN